MLTWRDGTAWDWFTRVPRDARAGTGDWNLDILRKLCRMWTVELSTWVESSTVRGHQRMRWTARRRSRSGEDSVSKPRKLIKTEAGIGYRLETDLDWPVTASFVSSAPYAEPALRRGTGDPICWGELRPVVGEGVLLSTW